MELKSRTKSDELMVMQSLYARMELTEKEKFHYLNLKKGYEGEVKFDLLLKGLREESYIICDLLLEVNNSYFQIDTLLISQGVIYLLDIKNYEGDCYIDSDKLYSVHSGREFKNPVIQLKRSTSLFRQLLQNFKMNYLVESSVIFINSEFTLYQAPMDQPIILPTQVNRFLRDLNKSPTILNDGHKKLAQKLISSHQTKNPFKILPNYYFDQLHKGVYCRMCNSFQITIKNNYLVCGNCREHEKLESAILRNTMEFKLLFPDRKITTMNIHVWCDMEISKKTFSRVLKKHYTAVGNTSDTYYE